MQICIAYLLWKRGEYDSFSSDCDTLRFWSRHEQ